jgi:hypothetical protein
LQSPAADAILSRAALKRITYQPDTKRFAGLRINAPE